MSVRKLRDTCHDGDLSTDGTAVWRRVTPNASSFPDKTIINRIMLKFRPIAPKPVSGDSSSDGLTAGGINAAASRKRVKRKYVRVQKNNTKKKIDPNGEGTVRSQVNGTRNGAVTLQLLPEKSDLEVSSQEKTRFDLNRTVTITRGEEFPFDNVKNDPTGAGLSDRTAVMSWVMVQSVTDNCMGEEIVYCTDVERVNTLENDTCPGFISDGFDKVVWVNQAYLKMVTGGVNGDLTVKLVAANERLRGKYSPALTGVVNMKYDTWHKVKSTKVLTVPCDVWRMDFGGFAWRLDVKAALRLGL